MVTWEATVAFNADNSFPHHQQRTLEDLFSRSVALCFLSESLGSCFEWNPHTQFPRFSPNLSWNVHFITIWGSLVGFPPVVFLLVKSMTVADSSALSAPSSSVSWSFRFFPVSVGAGAGAVQGAGEAVIFLDTKFIEPAFATTVFFQTFVIGRGLGPF